jgi:hypothetical protein
MKEKSIDQCFIKGEEVWQEQSENQRTTCNRCWQI